MGKSTKIALGAFLLLIGIGLAIALIAAADSLNPFKRGVAKDKTYRTIATICEWSSAAVLVLAGITCAGVGLMEGGSGVVINMRNGMNRMQQRFGRY